VDHVRYITLSQKLLHIIYAHSHKTKHNRIHSKNGVNFQVTLRQNHLKRHLPV
jgi:hypothetical protein